MAKGTCKTSDCDRAPQILGVVKGWCCAMCTIRNGAIHADICNIIEEVGRAELGGNIVLGYN